jgi:hypothetical protein
MPDKEIKLVQSVGQTTWAIYFGDRYDDQLTWDETLGCVASILLGNDPKYLRTKEEWEAWKKRLACK